MERITRRHLDGLCEVLNKITGSPTEAYKRDESGKLVGQIGNYHISGAYGGWNVHRMDNKGGGVSTPFSCGYIPARELYNRMRAYIDGIEEGKTLSR